MDEEGIATDFLKGFDWGPFDYRATTQEIVDKIEEPTRKFFMSHTTTEIYKGAMERSIMVYPVATVDVTLGDIQLAARGFWVRVEHPEIYMVGTSVFRIYISDGNLYLTKSEDSGATWGDAEQVNDVDGTVLSEECAADIHPAGIVWTDTRNGDKDIYFVGGEAAPAVGIRSISGGMGVSAEIENMGTADASNVQWSINLDGGLILVGKSAEGTINSLPAGGTATISIPFVLGIGSVTITVSADDAIRTASGTVILFFMTGVS